MKAQFYIKLWKLEGTNVNTTQTGNIQKQECQRKHLLKKSKELFAKHCGGHVMISTCMLASGSEILLFK